MASDNELEVIKRLISGNPHLPPSVDLLKSELRSDSGLEPPLECAKSSVVCVIIKWKFHIRYVQLGKFHKFLKEHEEQIIADVKDLGVGAAYLGTFAELPQCMLHQTLWSYESLAAIDQFKSALVAKKRSELYNRLSELTSFIDDPTLGMHRLMRASALAGAVEKQRKKDPILDMFAG